MKILISYNAFVREFETSLEEKIDISNGSLNPSEYDLLIFPGGEDICPNFYNRECTYSINTDRDRDGIEFDLFQTVRHYYKDIKILGVCRGHQLINVAMGGILLQDIGLEGFKSHPYYHEINKLCESKNPALSHIEEVNSLHHQGIPRKFLTGSLTPIFEYQGVVEAFTGNNILGVQWHPEFLRDKKFFDGIRKWVEGKKITEDKVKKSEKSSIDEAYDNYLRERLNRERRPEVAENQHNIITSNFTNVRAIPFAPESWELRPPLHSNNESS